MNKTLNYWLALPIALFRELIQGDITLRAMGLVYTTLLSITPLLALSFSVLKGFGVHNQLEPLLIQFMAPLGTQAEEVTKQVLGFVDNMQVGVLGIAGLATLIYTVLMLMQQIESAFNYLWQAPNNLALHKQFSKYMSVIMIAPIIFFITLGFFSALSHTTLVEQLSQYQSWKLILNITPLTTLIIIFTFIYIFIPNINVNFFPALGAGTIAALGWQLGGWLFASFVANSGQQTAIYSIFAGLFLFMFWMYIGWIIVLLGARLAYFFQYPEAVYQLEKPKQLSVESRELLATAVLREIALTFTQGQAPLTLEQLHERIPVSRLLLTDTLQDLIQYGIISQDNKKTPHYLLRISPNALTVEQIRARMWRGDSQQQKQADELRIITKLSATDLDYLHKQAHVTIQQVLEQHIAQQNLKKSPSTTQGSPQSHPEQINSEA